MKINIGDIYKAKFYRFQDGQIVETFLCKVRITKIISNEFFVRVTETPYPLIVPIGFPAFRGTSELIPNSIILR